jgi:hypothetical protein
MHGVRETVWPISHERRCLTQRNIRITEAARQATDMQLHDLLSSDLLLEMAYTQKKAERVITALEKPLNDTLLKLWTNPASAQHETWVENLVGWIDEISEIVIRPANVRPAHIFYYKLLFFEPFGGGAEVPNLLRRLRRLHRQGFPMQVDLSVDTLVKRLQTFHRDLASLCARKVMGYDQIRTFIHEH